MHETCLLKVFGNWKIDTAHLEKKKKDVHFLAFSILKVAFTVAYKMHIILHCNSTFKSSSAPFCLDINLLAVFWESDHTSCLLLSTWQKHFHKQTEHRHLIAYKPHISHLMKTFLIMRSWVEEHTDELMLNWSVRMLLQLTNNQLKSKHFLISASKIGWLSHNSLLQMMHIK